jgi:hypothetical protein
MWILGLVPAYGEAAVGGCGKESKNSRFDSDALTLSLGMTRPLHTMFRCDDICDLDLGTSISSRS